MISVIVPALNEQKALPATLAALSEQPGIAEILLVDGGSADATVAIARSFPGVTVVHSAPGRAVQMNLGAAQARGQLLLFVHADTLLPPGATEQLVSLCQSGDSVFGGFHQRFSGTGFGLRCVSALHNWRCRMTGVFYGDQAMFVSRDLFARVGGFLAQQEMEDIRLSELLLATGTQPRLLATRVVTDSRKFEQMGVLRAFLYCLLLLCCYELRLPLQGRRFFAAYR